MLKPTLITFAAVSLLTAAGPKLTTEQRAHALELLNNSEKEFLSATDGLTDEQWNFKASPEKWSIGQTAEHIMLSETLIFSAVMGAMQSPADPDWEQKAAGKAEAVEKAMLNRTTKAQAPEPLIPQSKLSREKILSRYKAAREKTIAFAKTTELPLQEHFLPNPFFGALNGYVWLITFRCTTCGTICRLRK